MHESDLLQKNDQNVQFDRFCGGIFLELWMVLAAPSATPWSLLGLVHSLISLTSHFFPVRFYFSIFIFGAVSPDI